MKVVGDIIIKIDLRGASLYYKNLSVYIALPTKFDTPRLEAKVEHLPRGQSIRLSRPPLLMKHLEGLRRSYKPLSDLVRLEWCGM